MRKEKFQIAEGAEIDVNWLEPGDEGYGAIFESAIAYASNQMNYRGYEKAIKEYLGKLGSLVEETVKGLEEIGIKEKVPCYIGILKGKFYPYLEHYGTLVQKEAYTRKQSAGVQEVQYVGFFPEIGIKEKDSLPEPIIYTYYAGKRSLRPIIILSHSEEDMPKVLSYYETFAVLESNRATTKAPLLDYLRRVKTNYGIYIPQYGWVVVASLSKEKRELEVQVKQSTYIVWRGTPEIVHLAYEVILQGRKEG